MGSRQRVFARNGGHTLLLSKVVRHFMKCGPFGRGRVPTSLDQCPEGGWAGFWDGWAPPKGSYGKEDLGCFHAMPRRLPANNLPEADAETVDVGGQSAGFVTDHFWCHPCRSAGCACHQRQVITLLGEAKITDTGTQPMGRNGKELDVLPKRGSVVMQQYVLRLQIPVHDKALMQVVHARGYFVCNTVHPHLQHSEVPMASRLVARGQMWEIEARRLGEARGNA